MLILSNVIENIVQEIESTVQNRTALLFVAENSNIDIENLISELNQKRIHFAGGIFPKVMYKNVVYEKGIVVNYIENIVQSFTTKNIEQQQFTIPKIELPRKDSYCTLTLVDGLTGNISNYLSELYRTLGTSCIYFGGGCGSLTLQQKPCIFNNTGFYMNAAFSIIYETKVSIGVKHGWEKVDGPLIATKTDKNTIQEINWRNAFEVYKEIIEKDSKQKITPDNFFSVAKAYPFGIVKENSECVVRDPIATNEKGELICVGEVLSNTMLDVLRGKNENLILSATEAARLTTKNAKNPNRAIIIDCISRVLFLEENFQQELDAVIKELKTKNEQMEISGALTLGEISSYNGYLEFFNKTIVVGLFETYGY